MNEPEKMQDFVTSIKHILISAFSQPLQLDAHTTIALTAAAQRAGTSTKISRPGPR